MPYLIQYSEEINKDKLIQKITSLGFAIESSGTGKEKVFWLVATNNDGARLACQIKEKSLQLKLHPQMKLTYLLSGVLAILFLFINVVLAGLFQIAFGPVLLLPILGALISLPIIIKRQIYESKHLFTLEELDKQLDEL